MEKPSVSFEQLGERGGFQTAQSYIVVKAAPRSSSKFGETVCIAGLNSDGSWVRLYPVSFKDLSDAQRFKRWDLIRYRWRRPSGVSDLRDESRRVDSQSVEIVGDLPVRERDSFLNRVAVDSLKKQRQEGKSLALLKVAVHEFYHKRKSHDDFAKEVAVRNELKLQSDLFTRENIIPKDPCPFSFFYSYLDADGSHTGTCQDWETEATFLRRRHEMGEVKALEWMHEMFGKHYPERGMALAMGTHRYRHDQWLINGVIRLNEQPQLPLL